MKLQLTIDAKHLDVEIDDVVAGLLAARLSLPEGADHRDAITRHLSEVSAPWVLDDEHMRKRVLRRLILEIADPTLLMRHLMTD
ncbi:MAG: hypothetical protein VYB88_18430 [Pseudomonadota bacterium]|uniref:Uncharacterized protein n=1 Tax=Ralstonia pickettii TaxID=329 RepID=A0A7X2HQH5_RALPI|nr:hypothetical protein [Ralstonia pickettii]MEE2979444.1 hypothetical protein [Pseudomonadota bacterium]MRT00801.1 hypothetical protein [Ralstonia pickettii]NWK43489.1 hypothetical protein [Ralstonia pickettii]OCS46435.1 hypothetical protein BEK67_16295 [Ralstonia pickettii]WKZ85048.1 hypothetical protein N5B55_15045 [Ralstonia pickettii]